MDRYTAPPECNLACYVHINQVKVKFEVFRVAVLIRFFKGGFFKYLETEDPGCSCPESIRDPDHQRALPLQIKLVNL